jgi:putative ABC transport system substrate-binding protein
MDIPGALNVIRDRIEALWLIPDLTVASPEMIELFNLFSARYNKPVFSFADKHLERGASLTVSISPVDIGRQAGELLKDNYAGKHKNNLYDVTVAKISVNTVVATKMALFVGETFRHENTVFVDISHP